MLLPNHTYCGSMEKFLQFGQVGQGLPRENTSSNIVFCGLPSKSVESSLPAVRVDDVYITIR